MIARPALRGFCRSAFMMAALATALPAFAQTAEMPKPADPVITESEESNVATLPPISPRWGFITDTWSLTGTRIFDGDTGKMVGMVHNASLANFAIDPAGKYFYMAETIWTKGNRGKRQDMLVIYDAATLKIVTEIPLTGRLLIGNRNFNLSISDDGKLAYIYNLDPASSVLIVDLVKKKLARTVEIPGCGLAFPAPDGSFSSLCADGALATVKKGGTAPSRSATFFSGEMDPIFDNSALDTKSGKALFLSYTGLLYEVTLGATPTIPEPWSIQEAAGLPKGTTTPLVVNWLPGGRQPITYNRTTGKAYILMHMGEQWSQKVPGTEVWEIDVAAHKVLHRKKLPFAADNIAVTQDAAPLLFVNSGEGKMVILDGVTFEKKYELEGVGTGNIAVAGG